MAIDPVTGALVLGGAKFLGGLVGGGGDESKLSKEQLRESRLQNRGATAVGLQRQMDMNPMRDKLVFNLMQRLGMSPGQFKPNDLFNGGTTGNIGRDAGMAGGVDLDQLAQKRAGYTPGAGGQTTGVAEDFLSRLGYGANPLRAPEKQSIWEQLSRPGGREAYRDEQDEFQRRMGAY